MRRGWAGLVLGLWVALALAETVQDVDNCKYRRAPGSPVGVTMGYKLCDRHEDSNTGTVYKWAGSPGTPDNTSWLIERQTGPVCGDGVRNQPQEQCDAPGGVGDIGSCQSITHCQGDCTCSPPSSTCLNSVLDPGEPCDPTYQPAEGSPPCSGRCTQACQCACVCGDGVKDDGCSPSGINEGCDFAPVTGINQGTAIEGIGGVDNGTTATAGYVDLELGGSGHTPDTSTLLDVGNGQVCWVFDLECPTVLNLNGTAFNTITWNGAQTNGTSNNGYGLGIQTTGNIRARILNSTLGSPVADQGTASTQANAVTIANKQHFGVCRDGSNLLTVKRLDRTLGETTHTCFSGASSAFCSSPSGSITYDDDWPLITTIGDSGSRDTQIMGRNVTSPAGGTDGNSCRLENLQIYIDTNASTLTADVFTNLDANLNATTTIIGPQPKVWYKFNDASVASITDSVTGTVGVTSGALTLVPSPATTGTGGGGEFGCTAPQTCDNQTCACVTPGGGPGSGRTFYVNPDTGSNSNAGSTSARWKDIAFAFGMTGTTNPSEMAPGDTLILSNSENYGEVVIDCNAGAADGTALAPITIKAENERMAVFSSGNGNEALYIRNCSYYIVDGITAAITADDITPGGAGDHTVFFEDSDHLTLKHSLVFRNDRCQNVHGVSFNHCDDCVAEENSIIEVIRHSLNCRSSSRVVFRRNYINDNNRQNSTVAACLENGTGPQPGGPSVEAVGLYPCSDSIVENNFVEGARSWGLNQHGDSGTNAARNTLIGNILAGGFVGYKSDSRAPSGPATSVVEDSILRHNLWIGFGTSFGFREQSGINLLIDRFAVINGQSGSRGVQSDEITPPNAADCGQLKAFTTSKTCRVTYSNGLIKNNASGGLSIEASVASGGDQRCTVTNISSNNPTSNFANLANSGGCATTDTDGSGANNCACSGNNTGAASLYGNATNCTNCCATFCPDGDTTCDGTGTGSAPNNDRGPYIVCKTVNGTTLSGTANGLWCTDTSMPGCAGAITNNTTCASAPADGPTTACKNGPGFCGATKNVIKGITRTDLANGGCRSFAQRNLNQNAADSGSTGCTGAFNGMTPGYACP